MPPSLVDTSSYTAGRERGVGMEVGREGVKSEEMEGGMRVGEREEGRRLGKWEGKEMRRKRGRER